MFHQNYFNMVIVQEETLDYFFSLFQKAKQVFFDTETTGFSRYNDRIVEFGALKLKNGIVVDKPVTVNGMGHTLDAKGTSPVFNITADDVNIFNVTYANANGTVIDVNADNVSISNSSFVNNTVENGSLIDASGTNGTNLTGNDFTGIFVRRVSGRCEGKVWY